MKKINLATISLFSLLFLSTPTSSSAAVATTAAKLAVAATISATASISGTLPNPSPTVTSIEDKIKNLVKENLSATESDLSDKINQKTLVGFVGNIKTISTDNISIESEGNVIQVATTSKTAIVKSGSTIKQSALAISDKVIVIGTLVKSDIIQAKRLVVVTEEPNPVVTSTIVATVSSVDTKKKIIGLMINNKEVLYSLSKKSTVKIAEIKVDQTIFAITKLYQGVNSLSRAKIL
jgi:hypothetical protein